MKTHWMGLIVCLIFGQAQAEGFNEEQAFRYELEMSRNAAVCQHMLQVYNEKFRQPWKTEPIDLAGKTYGEHSKYAFPRLPGVEHNDRFTFDMRYSKWPTSPEFEAIEWREGRRITGGGPVPSSSDGRSLPILAAEFDIDNDGHKEQVVKYAFVEMWAYTDYERISIFRQARLNFLSPVTSWQIQRGGGGVPQPEGISVWRHIRPFMLWGKVYLHLQHDVSHEVPNSAIIRERSYTLVSEYHHDQGIFDSGLDPITDDMPGIKQVCRFHMIPTE